MAITRVAPAAAQQRTSPPTGSPIADYLPADVTARERGAGEQAARLEAIARLAHTGLTAEAIALRTGMSIRTIDRLRRTLEHAPA